MNSTYFNFDGIFYKQTFGTPIVSVISPFLLKLSWRIWKILHLIFIDAFNSFHPRLQFICEIGTNNKIRFLDIELIKYMWVWENYIFRLNVKFFSAHPIENKITVIENSVDKAVIFPHESFHKENLNIIGKILVLNHYPQKLIWMFREQLAEFFKMTYVGTD